MQSQSFIYVDCDSKTHAVCRNLKILVWAAAGMMGAKDIDSFTPMLIAGANKKGKNLSLVGIFEPADIIKFDLDIFQKKNLKKYFIPCHRYQKFFINFLASDTADHEIVVNAIIHADGIGLIFWPSGDAYGFRPLKQKNNIKNILNNAKDLSDLIEYGWQKSLTQTQGD